MSCNEIAVMIAHEISSLLSLCELCILIYCYKLYENYISQLAEHVLLYDILFIFVNYDSLMKILQIHYFKYCIKMQEILSIQLT